mmetsp:Transcript_17871/g.34864  ORF Transcript_17871/g.34864 Transcript_17871/m.34864 type:complete len:162 (+) Transcript_17871:401-886(+)
MHSSTASSRAQPQAHVDKVIMRVLQPGSKQYNGQGVLLETVYLPLSGGDFDAQFGALWSEHVDFGTSRSHKKLEKRSAPMKWQVDLEAKHTRLETSRATGGVDGAEHKERSNPPQKRGKQETASSGPSQSRSVQEKTQPERRALPKTGRFEGTLAAKLLGQ